MRLSFGGLGVALGLSAWIVLQAAGCAGGGGGDPDGGAPDGGLPDGGVPDGGLPDGGLPDAGIDGLVIVDVSPRDATVDVSPHIVVSVTFDQPVDVESAEDGFRLIDSRGREVAGRFALGASPEVLVFEPERRLTLLRSYSVEMTPRLRSAEGGALSEPFASGFSVRDGAWSPPVELANASDPGWRDLELSSRAGFDGVGNAVAVWSQENEHQRDDVWASTLPIGGAWDEPALLFVSEPEQSEQNPRVAVSDDGSAVAIWRHWCNCPSYDVLWFSTYEPGDGWSGAAELPVPEGFWWNVAENALGGDGNGNVTAFWSQFHNNAGTSARKVWSATFSRECGWSVPEALEEDAAATEMQFRIGSGGDAVSVWTGYSGLRSSVRTAGVWGAPRELQDEGSRIGQNPGLDVNARGEAVAVWTDGAPGIDGGAVEATLFDPAVGWTGIGRADAHPGVEFPEAARLANAAIDEDGNAFVTWFFGHIENEVWVNRYDHDEGWGGAEMIGLGYRPRVEADSNGNAITVWAEGTEVMFARYVRGAGWSTAALLASDDRFVASEFELVVDSDGRNLLLWHTQREIRVEDDWVRFTRVYSALFE